MHPEEAEQNLALIRSMMERRTRYPDLPALACLAAGVISLAGVAACAFGGVDFSSPIHSDRLLGIWAAVCAVGALQFVALTTLAARRRGEPVWTRLAQRVVVATLPGIYVGAALTEFCRQTGNLDYLPPFWCLCYGTSLFGLGLYTGWKANLAGCLFLAAGTAGLFWLKPYGLWLMGGSFGGLHLLLAILIPIGHERTAAQSED